MQSFKRRKEKRVGFRTPVRLASAPRWRWSSLRSALPLCGSLPTARLPAPGVVGQGCCYSGVEAVAVMLSVVAVGQRSTAQLAGRGAGITALQASKADVALLASYATNAALCQELAALQLSGSGVVNAPAWAGFAEAASFATCTSGSSRRRPWWRDPAGHLLFWCLPPVESVHRGEQEGGVQGRRGTAPRRAAILEAPWTAAPRWGVSACKLEASPRRALLVHRRLEAVVGGHRGQAGCWPRRWSRSWPLWCCWTASGPRRPGCSWWPPRPPARQRPSLPCWRDPWKASSAARQPCAAWWPGPWPGAQLPAPARCCLDGGRVVAGGCRVHRQVRYLSVRGESQLPCGDVRAVSHLSVVQDLRDIAGNRSFKHVYLCSRRRLSGQAGRQSPGVADAAGQPAVPAQSYEGSLGALPLPLGPCGDLRRHGAQHRHQPRRLPAPQLHRWLPDGASAQDAPQWRQHSFGRPGSVHLQGARRRNDGCVHPPDSLSAGDALWHRCLRA